MVESELLPAAALSSQVVYCCIAPKDVAGEGPFITDADAAVRLDTVFSLCPSNYLKCVRRVL